MFKVSVIVPIFNVSKYLPRFFNSLKHQKLADVEYILVDDGSTDNSLQMCYKFQHEMNNVKVFHHKNMGVGPTRNIGLQNAKGKYVYFCDPDDTLKNDLLSDNYSLAEKYQADLVIFGFETQNITGQITGKTKLKFQFCNSKADFINIFPTLCHNFLINYLWNKFYRRKVIQNFRFEDVRTGEDIRFNFLVYNSISKVLINDKIYYYYFQGRSNSSQFFKKIDDITLYLQENKQLENLLFNLWNKKNNAKFISIVKKAYMATGRGLILRVEDRSNYIERNKILQSFSKYKLNKYIKFDRKLGFNFNYNVLIFKLRYVPFILSLDKLLRKLKEK